MKVTLTLAAIAFASMSAVAQAQSTEVSGNFTIDVPYGDLNLSHRAGAEAMLNRIQAAAVRVCSGQPEVRETADMVRYRSCVKAAVRNAVFDLNATMVTQLLAGNFGAAREDYVSQR